MTFWFRISRPRLLNHVIDNVVRTREIICESSLLGVGNLYLFRSLASHRAPNTKTPHSRKRNCAARWSAGSLAAIGLMTLTGCGELPQTIMDPAGNDARLIRDLFIPILWIALAIFIAVEGFLVISMIKYRQRSDNDAIPVQTHGNTRLEIVWMVVPAIIVAVLAFMTFRTMAVQAEAPGDDALVVEVSGNQWWWEFNYPELGIVTANELYLPVGQEVDVRLSSDNVLHSFWLPKLAGKLDVVPGVINKMKFTPERIGEYFGQCAEFCGLAHAQMRMKAFVVAQADFDRWVQIQLSGASPELATSAGAQVFQANCAACHSIKGTTATFGQLGPELTAIGLRTTLGAGIIDHTPETMAEWIRDPSKIKPGVLMPTLDLSETDIDALVTYLENMR